MDALKLHQDKLNKGIGKGKKEVLTDFDVQLLCAAIMAAGTGTTFRATVSFIALMTDPAYAGIVNLSLTPHHFHLILDT